MISHRKNRGRRRGLRVVVLGLIAAFIIAELVARFGLGLGDPPLFVRDDTVEYLIKPGTYRRFGHAISINRWSQRSPEIDANKSDPNELRVLVIGDSVVNGGALLDDSQIATRLLEDALRAELSRPVRVLNIAAGSWGPQNQLAYLEKFGTFGADAAVIVWSSHDAWDVPRFDGLRDDQPEQRPLLAVGELVGRYVLPRLRTRAAAPGPTDEDFAAALRSAGSLVAHLKAQGVPIAIVLHDTRGEIEGKPADASLERGRRQLADLVSAQDIPVLRTRDRLEPGLARGEPVFQDDIHPTATGQALVARSLRDAFGLLRLPTGPASP
ncbi:MAG TPA: SGNH/GDSL hydrolase family protein [Phycisphaerales bacterium]